MIGIRILRKRSVLTAVFLFSLVYFIANIIIRIVSFECTSQKAIDWKVGPKDGNETAEVCRNSVQGWTWIVDEQGYVCSRSSVLPNGCCPQSSVRFSCQSCQMNCCCAVFEYCVSCCMQPDKKMKLRKTFVRLARAFPYLFSSVNDVFELCLSKCRTSSHSLQHENTYRDPLMKFCYGSDLPALQIT
ncbi:hypothetical protein HELRODRAFT_157537 [Helobdella robusta]|uniref:SREBP regulating gene protein n=1 Tax=Helobdella robusta TaxID=6412 RepID=T1EMC8_HELRO|nr:hypothetical protein HELRODRAFT_157537 [Helobdella robusta]ESN97791.1 hypothetical protein HELRODRAFT_157537 [Helobdella robusta]